MRATRGRRRGGSSAAAGHTRASRSAPQAGGEEAATEEEEQEQEPVAEAAAAPGKLPALGKKDLTRLVERFGALGFHLPKDIEKLNPEDARILYNTHLQTWGLTIRDTPLARGPLQPRVFVTRPPMETCEYYQDLSNAKLRELLELPRAERAGKLPIWSSAVPAVNAQTQARGYVQQPLVDMETDAALPPILPPAESADDDDDDEQEEEEEGAPPAAPAQLSLPATLPPLPKGKPAAAQIVREFEEYVEVDGVSYSPLRLWTLEARQKKGAAMMKQTSNFGRRAHLYLYILSRNEIPAQILEKESKLRALMVAWKKDLGAEAEKNADFDAAVKAADDRIAAAALINMQPV